MTSPPESGPDRGHLLTEQANPLSERLDQLPTDELVGLFCANEREPQRALEAAAPALAAAVDAIAARLQAGGRLFYLGAGTSGRLGVLDAAECPPTFCTAPQLVQGVHAGGAPALLRRLELPLLLIWGQRDRLVPVQVAQQVRRLRPELPLTVLPGSGHCPHDEHADAFNSALLQWLGQLPAAETLAGPGR